MNRLLITLLIFFIGNIAFAQTNISGIVKDEKGPLIGANVFMEGTYDGTTTDLDGKFLLTTQQKGEKNIIITYLGYKTFKQSLDLEGRDVFVEAVLLEAFNKLKAVTITAGAFEAGDKKKTVVLNSIDMITTAGSLGDVTGSLQTLPGTTTVGESGKLFVRGGTSDESKTYIDGTQVLKPYNTQVPNLSTRGRFNPFMFEGTVFSTGGYSAEYGQALSSVLLLETKGLQSKDQLDVSIMTLGGDMAGTKKWKSGAITASLGYTDLKPYMGLVPQRDDWVRAPQSVSGALSFRQRTGGEGLFKLYSSYDKSYLRVRQKSVNDALNADDYALTNNNSYTNAHWRGILSDKWAMQWGASYTYDHDDIIINKNSLMRTLKGGHLKTKFTNYLSDRITFKIGAEYLTKSYAQLFSTDTTSFTNEFFDPIYAGFAEAELYLSNDLVFRVGMREEYSDLLDENHLTPRLSAAYKLSSKSQISLAYGSFYQNPKDEYLLYTEELKQERADHYMFNYQYDKNHRNIRAEVYYKDYKNLVKITDPRFYLPDSYNNEGNGYAYGFDLYFRDKKTIKNGDYWVSYSYLQSKRNYKDFPELVIPGYVSTHNLSLVYKHWLPKLKSFPSITYQYGSPRFYTDKNKPGFQNQKIKAYQNLSVSWTYLYRQNVIFFASVKNVLGFKNEFGYNFSDQPDNTGVYRSQKIEQGATRFFFMGCFITFSKDENLNQLDKIDN